MKKIYLDEIESKGNELVNFSKNNIASKINELKDAVSKFEWEGIAHDTYVNGYYNRINRIVELNNKLCKLSQFLLQVREDYGTANGKIETAYEEIIDDFRRLGVLEDELQ